MFCSLWIPLLPCSSSVIHGLGTVSCLPYCKIVQEADLALKKKVLPQSGSDVQSAGVSDKWWRSQQAQLGPLLASKPA